VNFPAKKISFDQALKKAQHYCAYQERSHAELKTKLYSYGLFTAEVNEILALLIQDNFLNEQRFAEAFVSGKFKIKHWGRTKIIAHLKQKGVSDYCIKKGLCEIDEELYQQTLTKLMAKKLASSTNPTDFSTKQKVANYLIMKGYEYSLVFDTLKLT